MRGLIQRVTQASVTVNHQCIGEISTGALLLLGVEADDNEQNAAKMVNKVLRLRMFNDQQHKMNLNLEQIAGQILVISQFTLVADTHKGNRPGFSKGATPEHGLAMYQRFIELLTAQTRLPQDHIATGQFGADMQVALINDGPVTFSLQT